MENTENSKSNQESDLKDIDLSPGIYDFTVPIMDYLENGNPLTQEQRNILKTFNSSYSLEQDIQDGSRDLLLKEFKDARTSFNFDEAKKAVKEGLLLAQRINPDNEIEGFPVVFLFLPLKRSDATSLRGQGCAININSLKQSDVSSDTPFEKIITHTAHEATHIFLKQLGKKPTSFSINRDPLKKGIYDFLWEEGLTTYVEPTHYRHHFAIKEDVDFWIGVIKKWLVSDDSEQKEKILEECINRPSAVSWFNDMFDGMEIPNVKNLNTEDLDLLFLRMLTEGNGPGYHIGSYLWEKQIEKGKKLKDLVMRGSEEMEKWVREE